MKWKKICSAVLVAVMACLQFSALATAFTDVNANYDWAKEAIDSFTQQGIIQGKGDGLFAPDDLVTREEVAKMLCLTFDISLSKPQTPSFSDVPEDKWSYEYIESSKDYVVWHTTFYAPEEPATRAEITEAIVNVLGLAAKDETERDYAKTVFSDLNGLELPRLEKISLAALYGLVEGYGDGTFGPDKNLTRAEAVVLLKRAQDAAAQLTTPTPAPTATVEPTTEPSSEPSATPAVTPTAAPTTEPQRPDDAQYAIAMSITKASVDGESCYKLYYNMNGKPGAEPIVIRTEATVTGAKQNIESIACGDIFLADYDAKDRAKTICVLFSPGTGYPAEGKETADFFIDMLNPPNRASWYLAGEANNAIDEIYFGYIGEVKNANGGISMTVLGADGDFNSSAAQYFFVPDSANVLRYTAVSSLGEEARFKNADVLSIEASYFPKDKDGNVDFSSEEFRMKDMCYAFVHLHRGEVADVVLIDYSK